MAKYKHIFHAKWRWQRVTQIMARDGLCCAICTDRLDRRIKDPMSEKDITFDHVQPVSRGGLAVLANLRLAHRACNERRGNDPLPEVGITWTSRTDDVRTEAS